MDRELVERARSGDHDAFEVLAAGIVDHCYAVARLILRDADRAEDAAQEALVRCWRDLPSLRDVDRFDAWLGRLLMHAINDEFRRGSRFRARSLSWPANPPSPTDRRDRRPRAPRPRLRPPVDRAPHRRRPSTPSRPLHRGDGDTLGIPVGTAKSRLHYATEALRRALEADAEPRTQEVSA